MTNETKQILIVSTCTEDWGGSEELWARSIPHLQDLGYQIAVGKPKINLNHKEFKKLESGNVALHELNIGGTDDAKGAEDALSKVLQNDNFSLVIISQGINFDGLGMGYVCLCENVPYVLIAQKAVESFWPYQPDRVAMRNVYLNARQVFFVSQHNLVLTEEQFGVRFNHAKVIFNPVKVARQPRPYPGVQDGFRLACIGRSFLIDKGQDILIRIMAQEKWKSRPLKISFIGSGVDKPGLIELAQLLQADNVEFLEPTEDIKKLWDNYHGLVLPSRFEGTPLVLLEAMALGRTAIVTDAGGNAELITNNHSGFIGQPTVIDFEQAMERAWQARKNWKTMGEAACDTIKKNVPKVPELNFAREIDKLIAVNPALVSVIIPTYNRFHIVESAIRSVLSQTYPYIQLIVADDGSSDQTDELMSKYPDITYLKLPHGGQAQARNEGLRQAIGNYVATLDSDDTWEPDFLQKCVNLIDTHNLDFVFTNWMQDVGNGESMDRFSMCKVLEDTLRLHPENTVVLQYEQLRKIYLTGCPSPSSSLLFKRSSLKSNWSSGLRIADDWCLLMDIIYTKPCKAAFTRDILWTKKVDGKNIYDGRDHYDLVRDLWTHDLEFLFDRFKTSFSKEEKKQVRLELSKHYLQYAYHQLVHKKNYLISLKYSSSAFMANNLIALQAFVAAKLKVKKAIKRLKLSV